MIPTTTSFSSKKISILVFVLSVLVTLFWMLGNLFDVYQFAIVGVLFEITWLPVVAMTFILPVVALFLFVKDKFHLKSLNLYSFVMVVATALVMMVSL